MSSTICVFEDEKAEGFLPLAYTRPVFDLRCGIRTLFQKVAQEYEGNAFFHLCRPYLSQSATCPVRMSLVGAGRDTAGGSGQVLFLNGRLLVDPGTRELIAADGPEELFVSDDDLVAARLSGPRLNVATKWLSEQDSRSVLAAIAAEVPVSRVEVQLLEYPWDLIHQNGAQIVADHGALGHRASQGNIHPAAVIYGSENVYVASGAEVMAGAVLDARDGPIYVDRGARVEPFSFVQGPTFIGRESRIVSARIREDTSIGPYCRVGGEVESSIFHGYSNKYHDGFVGHSYFGEWVNIGALTTTSDLKNTYGTVRVEVGGQQIDTELTKLGAIVGDHVKLGIGVLLNSGSTIGTGCNLFGGGMLPKVVPCFVWGGGGEFQEYDFDRMVQTAEIAMGRRDVEQTRADSEILRYVFEVTAGLRRAGRI